MRKRAARYRETPKDTTDEDMSAQMEGLQVRGTGKFMCLRVYVCRQGGGGGGVGGGAENLGVVLAITYGYGWSASGYDGDWSASGYGGDLCGAGKAPTASTWR